MKKVFEFLFSMLFTGILIVFFAIAIGYATFIENDYGTITAKILIYNARWFEGLLLLLCINLIGSVFQNKLITKKKWPILLFHLAFLVIAVGAALTRYVGYEGTMHIRENQASNTMVSSEMFVTIKAKSGTEEVIVEDEVKFSAYTGNSFSHQINIGGKNIKIQNLQYMPSAVENLIIDPEGEPIVSIIAVGAGNHRIDFNLRAGDSKVIDGVSIGFETPGATNDIHFERIDGFIHVSANDTIFARGMTQNDPEVTNPGEKTEVGTQLAYSCKTLNFAVKQFVLKGKTQLLYEQPQQGMASVDALHLKLSSGEITKEMVVYGSNGQVGYAFNTFFEGVAISVSYGAKIISLPFSIHLNDFQLERYPGSNSPSSYASEVVLKDGSTDLPFRIFMNNILKYKGYRFFQSSYDTDERGTILSVNHDSLGTSVTYFGYFLMALGMLLTLFTKQSRFKALVRASAKLREERKKLFSVLIVGLLLTFTANAQNSNLDKKHTADFGELVTQSMQGRLEPVSTLASEVLRKVAKKTSWDGMNSTEVFLDMLSNPEKWKNIPLIKVSNPELRSQLGASGKYVTYNSIVLPRERGGYRLSEQVSAAYAKKSNERNKFDKEVMNVDERVNILMNVFSGDFLTIFPVPGDDNHKWVSINQVSEMDAESAKFARETLVAYVTAVSNRDWASANMLLNSLKKNQEQNGAKVIPAKTKIKLEVFYNNINIFGKLSKILMFAGLIMLFVQLANLFNPNFKIDWFKKTAFVFIALLFMAETAGLGIRWYISGHAPWSNGYESMLFISWATLLGGLIFANRSEITLSLTSVLSGLTLMVAGMSWMSPEITPLVPVLKSYWLIVHVAIITASYGFLGISALLGFLNLILIIFRNNTSKKRINLTVKELVNIIQIAMIIGLLLLTVGSFLGGVWANESWGRYWGWDPKETWALVTILVYTFIGHMHKIPGFRGSFAVSTAAVLGISAVLMTYFGVNYYLSGLHSYAQGEPAPIPTGVYIAVVIVIVVILAAFFASRNDKEITEATQE